MSDPLAQHAQVYQYKTIQLLSFHKACHRVHLILPKIRLIVAESTFLLLEYFVLMVNSIRRGILARRTMSFSTSTMH